MKAIRHYRTASISWGTSLVRSTRTNKMFPENCLHSGPASWRTSVCYSSLFGQDRIQSSSWADNFTLSLHNEKKIIMNRHCILCSSYQAVSLSWRTFLVRSTNTNKFFPENWLYSGPASWRTSVCYSFLVQTEKIQSSSWANDFSLSLYHPV
jgi:hypothetical protein